MAIDTLPKTVTKEVLFKKAQERFQSWCRAYAEPNVTAQWMYEDMSASCYSGCPTDDFPDEVKAEQDKPVLDPDYCFTYKGYQFELTSCNCIARKDEMLGLTEENFNQHFPHGVFSDRYACWMYSHKDIEGKTKEESEDPDTWTPNIYLISHAWAWGAGYDLKPGAVVSDLILCEIDNYLETFNKKEVHN